ncbi:protein of unknown function [Trichlorobacter ammonificans]|uniref:Uncharacterized protein n=1 Tax=Trichlorobacter ammonificans TaxID=2916410 RepID=A0ABM9DC00_9BACT|nr:protein of unknown function [Trichlorobacter ammonificans]
MRRSGQLPHRLHVLRMMPSLNRLLQKKSSPVCRGRCSIADCVLRIKGERFGADYAILNVLADSMRGGGGHERNDDDDDAPHAAAHDDDADDRPARSHDPAYAQP